MQPRPERVADACEIELRTAGAVQEAEVQAIASVEDSVGQRDVDFQRAPYVRDVRLECGRAVDGHRGQSGADVRDQAGTPSIEAFTPGPRHPVEGSAFCPSAAISG